MTAVLQYVRYKPVPTTRRIPTLSSKETLILDLLVEQEPTPLGRRVLNVWRHAAEQLWPEVAR